MILFETGRLVVRHWTERPADLARIFDIYSRWEVSRWLGVRPRPMTDPDEAAERVRRWRAGDTTGGDRYGVWAVQVRATGQLAGSVLVKRLPGRDDRPTADVEVGWHLHPDSWGHGYATEAARGAVGREFAAGGDRVHALVLPGNAASVAVTRRLGMTPLGRCADWYGGLEVDAFVLDRRPDRATPGAIPVVD
ncbi:MAG TPA: GNAT family N-acetyltransferase [Micromonospora sp.]